MKCQYNKECTEEGTESLIIYTQRSRTCAAVNSYKVCKKHKKEYDDKKCIHCGEFEIDILHRDRDNSKYHPFTSLVEKDHT